MSEALTGVVRHHGSLGVDGPGAETTIPGERPSGQASKYRLAA